MIANERSPALRWRASLLGHVLGDRGLPDLNAELKQLTMDPWRAPERVSAYLERCLRPARARPRSPAPIGPQASAVPADHGLRLDDLQSIEHSRSQMIELGKHQAVTVSKGHSLGRFSPQNIELMS